MGDWLGTGTIAPRLREYRSFKEARTFAHGLKLNSIPEWLDYCKSGKRPSDIPTSPQTTYSDAGWSGYGDWLGTGTVATNVRQYRPFKRARTFARSLKLKSRDEWSDYCKSGNEPNDIPADAFAVYSNDGWAGMGDWLGTGRNRLHRGPYRPFKEARAFVHGLKLKSAAEWSEYCKSGTRPKDIPSNPNQKYVNDGWVGYGDWLGTGAISPRLRKFRPFKEARAFARSLKLNSNYEWVEYWKSAKVPDLPAYPNQTYANDGWTGWGDWLGTGRVSWRFRKLDTSNNSRCWADWTISAMFG